MYYVLVKAARPLLLRITTWSLTQPEKFSAPAGRDSRQYGAETCRVAFSCTAQSLDPCHVAREGRARRALWSSGCLPGQHRVTRQRGVVS